MEDVIPTVVDGLKDTERIVLYTALKKYGADEMVVEQLAKDSYMFCPTQKYLLPYRMRVITGMVEAVDGTHNISLFVPVVGKPDVSRGADMLIQLNPIIRLLFHEVDVDLSFKFWGGCQGCRRLPLWFFPIIPLVLVNGADCKVSGYRSYVPKYNPKDIIANLRHLLNNEKMKPMIPWFKGFKGSVEACPLDEKKFIVCGVIGNFDTEAKTVDVTELPVGISAQLYVSLLDNGSVPNKGYVDVSADTNQSLCLRVSLLDEDCILDVGQLLERLKLTSVISVDDMYLTNNRGMAHKYDSPLEVINNFHLYMFTMFSERKKVLLDNISRRMEELDIEIEESCSIAKQCINRMTSVKGKFSADMKDLFDELINQNISKVNKASVSVEYADKAKGTVAALLNKVLSFEESSSGDFLHLLETVEKWIRRLTNVLEGLEELLSDKRILAQKLDELKKRDASTLWLDDLVRLEKFLSEQGYLGGDGEKGTESVSHQSAEGSTSFGMKRKRHSLGL